MLVQVWKAKAARDARIQIHAEGDGVVEYVDANEIHVRYDRNEADRLVSFEDDLRIYKLTKFIKTNQETCINLKPAVKKGQKVKKGDFLTEGYATQNGELALGSKPESGIHAMERLQLRGCYRNQ